jgi:hypothetical protein
MTYYDDFKNNENYKITLKLSDASVKGKPTTRIVTAVLQNDIALAGGNDFTTAGDAIGTIPAFGDAQNLRNKAEGAFKLAGKSLATQFESALVWSNSLKPNINIEMTFYQDSINNKDIMEDYLNIKSAVLPNSFGAAFSSPLGYSITRNKLKLKGNKLNPKGLISLQIGTWLRMTGMVMVSESFTMSKEVNALGNPLFITGSITLEPYKALTYKEFKKYFINRA